ncbi:hypothetical protein EXU29_18490 [Acinetobacter wuhouensis]|uniref:PDZ domain-containing protein n=1 Tax=Acinetobacter wuhouensis TaxID=1879050 RepID=UPI0010236E26|nr:PDZ domain-containing protein [Acinetobacter wuhouensis]RZG66418.1 hypothetical protein EXU29_18490 [Acinetobacter wuhouensis]
MKKKILLISCSLLAISNISFASPLDDFLMPPPGASNIEEPKEFVITVNLGHRPEKQPLPTVNKKADEQENSLNINHYTYMYQEQNGATLISNKPFNDANLKLIKVTKSTKTNEQEKREVSRSNLMARQIILTSDGRYTDVPITSHPLSSSSSGLSIEQAKTVTNVSKFYKPIDRQPESKKHFEYLKPNENVKIIDHKDTNVDLDDLEESGYVLLGSSRFMDRKLFKNDVIEQAKKIGATLVIFYKETDVSIPYSREDDPNNFDIIYNYIVLFYVKDLFYKQPDMFGIRMGNIPINERPLYQRNTGVYVHQLTQDSKAYNANILVGDVIVSINNRTTLSPEEFNKVKPEELKKTKTLNLKILRIVKGDLKEIEIPISF